MKLRFPSVGGLTCSVQGTLQNAKHQLSMRGWGLFLRKLLKNRITCSEIESGAF